MIRIMITGVRDESGSLPMLQLGGGNTDRRQAEDLGSFKAISRAEPSASPTPRHKNCRCTCEIICHVDQSSASARVRRPVSLSTAPLSASSSASSAMSATPAAIEPITVFVAATECSLRPRQE